MSLTVCAACRAADAVVYCDADAAFLCALCDHTIHSANKLASRHTRLALTPPTPFDASLHASCDSLLDASESSTQPSQSDHSLMRLLSSTTTTTTTTAATHIAPSRSTADMHGFLDALVPCADTLHAVNTADQRAHKRDERAHKRDERAHKRDERADKHERALSCIAGAFVKKEAETLLQSSGYQLDALVPQLSSPYDMYNNGWSPSCHTPCAQALPSSRVPQQAGRRCRASLPTSSSSTTTTMTAAAAAVADMSHVMAVRRSGQVSFTEESGRAMNARSRDRLAALQRFRNKRANRSFRKRVRYACRKQLADSRPRVKGRFVGRNAVVAPIAKR